MTSLVPIDPAGDPQELLERLAARLEGALPAPTDAVQIERERSLGDRLSGRPGRVSLLRVARGDTAMTLRLQGRGLTAESARVVGGVVIARSAMTVGEWLTAVSGQVAALAADLAGDASAASTALAELGLQPAGADLVVPERDLTVALSALPARVAGRCRRPRCRPCSGSSACCSTRSPAWPGAPSRRCSCDAPRPSTPRDAAGVRGPPGGLGRIPPAVERLTAADALLAQRRPGGSRRPHARRRDHRRRDALLVNGRFLADRFAISSLDLDG